MLKLVSIVGVIVSVYIRDKYLKFAGTNNFLFM